MASNKKEVRRILDAVKAEGRTSLTAPEGKPVCDAYGIAVPKEGVASHGRRGGEARHEDRLPGRAEDRLAADPAQDGGGRRAGRREERRGRAQGLRDDHGQREEVRRARPTLLGVQVQQMVAGGQEVIVGAVTDPAFGKLVAFGLGGILVEVLKDITFRLAPASKADALSMLDGIAAAEILKGVRGADAGRPRGARDDDQERLAARRRLPRDRRDGPEPGVRDEERARSPPTCASSSTGLRSRRATARARRRSSAR